MTAEAAWRVPDPKSPRYRRLAYLMGACAALAGAAPGVARSDGEAAQREEALRLGLAGRSRDGRYSFEVMDGGPGQSIVVRRRPLTQPVASIPLGAVRNLSVRFVAGDNLLAAWSCGSPCQVGTLFSPDGRKLASLTNFEVSPDGNSAVSVEILDLKTGDSDVELVDLRSGKSLGVWPRQPGVWKACERRWEADALVLLPCGAKLPPLRYPLRAGSRP